MKKFLIAGVAAAAFYGTPALAADMAVKAPPPPPAPVWSWTGWYVGLNVGGNWATSQTSTTVGNSTTGVFYPPGTVNAINAARATNFNTSGFTGGFQGGYNFQMNQWLLGVEADFEYFRSAGSTGQVNALVPFTLTSSVSTDWLFTLRPRLGIISNNWLFYGTGGLAVTELHASWNYLSTTVGGTVTESASVSPTKAGWTIGGGVETALPGKYTLGVEYLYVKFDSVSTNNGIFINTPFGTLTNPINQSANLASNIVRLRLSKSF
jgi:outer membrane immunogenic protein